ncbi:hypothetical protein [Halococcus sp. AFM35]|uniref:hypothetical protein n=1 Tax=Halococcus sp. AFM35 TaxID=3421653 RepID=UPI003EB71239
MPRLKLRSPTDKRIDYNFRSSGPIQDVDDAHEDVSGNEVKGHLSTGDDVIEFAGVPLAFRTNDAAAAWDLDIFLDMGSGVFTEFMPTYLNAPTITVRSSGAHYLLGVAGPGMLLKGATADDKDGVLDGPNRLVAGNVRNNGEDSYRLWPPLNVSGIADGPAKFKNSATDAGWQDLSVVKPKMEF